MINLSKDYVKGSLVKLKEPRNGLKDKYVTSAMANLFVQEELEVKLTEKRNTRWDCKRAMKFKAPRTHY